MTDILKDFPPGPLDFYRKKASFDWKKLKLMLYGSDYVRWEIELTESLKNFPEFQENLISLSLDEERRLVNRQYFHIRSKMLDILEKGNPKMAPLFMDIITNISPAAGVKYYVGVEIPINVMTTMGTARHQKFIDEAKTGNIQGCFCLTEIGHGSDTKGIRTTATFNSSTCEFVLNTPDFQAAKCWAGGLGQAATYAIVYAQMYTQNNHYGLNAFIVPIRDPKTLIPFPGVIVADIGEKMGLNGLDNGLLMFDNYHIPRENLLNRTCDVTEVGQYITTIKNDAKRFGLTLGALSASRVVLVSDSLTHSSTALVIALRYAGIRKQFGPTSKEELNILEYQTHQFRLLPYLAAVYVMKLFSQYLQQIYSIYYSYMETDERTDILAELGVEIHAISCAAKAIFTWTSRDIIQECRETCGGHGYLKVSGIGNRRNDHDPCTTYEGENHVLLQQTGKWLLKFWPDILNGKTISSHMKSVDFLTDALDILKTNSFSVKNVQEICQPETIFGMYQWLISFLLKITYERQEKLIKNGGDPLKARHDNQVFFAKKLSIAFMQYFILEKFNEFIQKSPDSNIKNVLSSLFSLYALWSLEKFSTQLYQGSFAVGPRLVTLLQEGILQLLENLKNDAVALADVLAPQDFALRSVLGESDGQMYYKLQSAIFRSPYAMSRPSWWTEIVHWRQHIKSQL